MPTEWYEMDSGAVAAVVPLGIHLLPVGCTAWDWHPRDSDGWNALHQGIYRNHRASSLPGPPPGAPDLPAPGPPAIVDRDAAGRMARDPKLLAWIGDGRPAFVTSKEDEWESRCGDGVFRYLAGCFPTEAEAAGCDLGGTLRHVRRVDLTVVDGAVLAIGQRDSFADRYEVEDALADLVKRLP